MFVYRLALTVYDPGTPGDLITSKHIFIFIWQLLWFLNLFSYGLSFKKRDFTIFYVIAERI